MKKRLKTPPLKDGSRVAVIGGGPAGSFFAIHLLREAKQAGLNVSVTVIEKKIGLHGDESGHAIQGCNFCAGVISPRLHDELIETGLRPPAELICEEFTHIWLHGMWKNFPLKIPRGQRMYSVFRGTLPRDRKSHGGGLDNFLLNEAAAMGAEILPGKVIDIRRSVSGKPVLTVKTPSGKIAIVDSDFVAICIGIKSHPEKAFEDNPVVKAFQRLNPAFRPPKIRPALIFELKTGRDYLKKYLDKEIYFIVSGSKKLRLDHIALVPKKDYLTVALAGKSIDEARLPEDTGRIVRQFLSLAHVKNIIPGISAENPPVACACSPFMPTRPAREPFADRVAPTGDLLGARLYRDGLFSAFVTARALARTVVHKGLDSRSLSEGCGGTLEWLEKDDRYGAFVFGLFQTALKSPVLSRVFYQAFATEMKFQTMDRWPLGGVLRKIGSGASDFEDVFRELTGLSVLRSILRGTWKTARNVLTEILFGVEWEAYGRYPTVILKEKRDYFKKSIAAPLGIVLDDCPEMERMYAVKIRASAKRIFEELARFGDPDSRFLRLRFVDVRRVSGKANQAGAVVRYKLKFAPVSMNIRLTRSVPEKTLLYEPDELFAENGKLLFDITPTKDGNNRLVVYTAFDFKKGKSGIGKVFRRFFKLLFPEYAHDVVWNHGICRIKGDAERNEEVMSKTGGG